MTVYRQGHPYDPGNLSLPPLMKETGDLGKLIPLITPGTHRWIVADSHAACELSCKPNKNLYKFIPNTLIYYTGKLFSSQAKFLLTSLQQPD